MAMTAIQAALQTPPYGIPRQWRHYYGEQRCGEKVRRPLGPAG